MLAPDLALTTPYRFMQCLRKYLKVLVNVRIDLTFSYTLFILILSYSRELYAGTDIYCRHTESSRTVLFHTPNKTTKSPAHFSHFRGAT